MVLELSSGTNFVYSLTGVDVKTSISCLHLIPSALIVFPENPTLFLRPVWAEPVEELLHWNPICSAPGSFRHSAVYAFIHDFGPVLRTDLMCDLIHRDNSFKKLVVFWSYYLMDG